jgi:hypothetical protein
MMEKITDLSQVIDELYHFDYAETLNAGSVNKRDVDPDN